MAIENTAHRIGHRFVHIIAFDQDGVECGNRPHFAGARAFEQPRQHGKYGRSITARRRRFADRESDFALGHGKTRHRIHHE